jgi:hypothetical protein
MQTQLPEGLRALINASQILQEESTPVVQTPVGPKPTVAGMVSQGLQQLAQPVGMQNVGQQAGLGAQIQAQQMARQQQMAQSPEAIAQLAAQMLQRRPEQEGIANLPANMGFREGGIIGYNGETGSQVEDIAAKAARELALIEQGALLGPSPEVESYLKSQAAPPPVVGSELDPLVAAVSPAAGAPQGTSKAYRGTPDVREAIPELYARMYPERRQPAPAPTDRAEPPVSIPSAPVVPTAASIMEKAATMFPDQTQAQIQRRRELREEEEKARAGMANLEQEGIAAIQASAQERRAAAQRTKEDDNLRRFIAFANSVRYGNNAYVDTLSALDQRDALERKADYEERLAVIKLKDAEQNRKLGKFERERADLNAYDALIKESQKARQDAINTIATLDANVFGAQSRSRDVAMQMASAAQDRALTREQRDKFEKDRRIDAIDKTINELLQKRQAAKLAPQISMMMGNSPDAIKMREQQPDLWNNYVRDQAAINQQLQVLQDRRNQLVGIDGFGQLTVQ